MKWRFGARVIEGIPVDRARERLTAMVSLTDSLSVGVEWNPRGEDIGPLVNWRVMDETESRPALILGTSSDRIGTPRGRAYYGTFSKDIETWTGLPVAPYAGVSFGEYEDEWNAIGGLNIRWSKRWSTTHLYDGVNLHHLLGYSISPRYQAGVLAAEQEGTYYLGITFGVSL